MQFNHCIQQLPRPTLYLKLYFQARDIVSTQCLGFTMSDGQGSLRQMPFRPGKSICRLCQKCAQYAKNMLEICKISAQYAKMCKNVQNVWEKLQKYAKVCAEYAHKYAKKNMQKMLKNAKHMQNIF